MLLAPDHELNRALSHLCEQRDFVRVLQWIERSKFALVDDLVAVQEPVRVHQMQGYGRALADVLRAARTANPTLPAYLG